MKDNHRGSEKWFRFLEVNSEADDELKNAKDILGWQNLTTDELVGMVEWYRDRDH